MDTIEKHIMDIENAVRSGDDTYVPPTGMQIYRQFLCQVGYTPAEYLKRRRLSIALARIRSSEWSDAEIAYDCGYSSQQSMCREIKSQLGMTATEYRQESSIYYFPPYSGRRVCSLTVSKQTIPAVTALHYDAPRLRGLESAAIHQFFRVNPEYCGRLFGRDGGQTGSSFRYTLYVTEKNIRDTGFTPGGNEPSFSSVMAVTSTPNSEKNINDTWDWLYSRWLPHSCFRYAGKYSASYETQYFEEYLHKNQKPFRLKLYLPVVRSDEFYKIRITAMHLRMLICTASGADAQTKASRQLINSLKDQYPYLLQKTECFVIYEQASGCSTCGVLCEDGISGAAGPLHFVEIKEETCLHMELTGGCDPEKVEEIMTDFALENGFTPQTPSYFLYRMHSSATDVYLPLK